MSSSEFEIEKKALSLLSGQRLTGVNFVLDYFILQFDNGYIVVTSSRSEAADQDSRTAHGQSGFCDKIVGWLGRFITETSIENEGLTLHLEGGKRMTCSFGNQTESLHFSIDAPERHCWVI